MRASCCFGHDESHHAHGQEVMDEMLNPGIVGVVHRRHPKFPPQVLPHPRTAGPTAHLDGCSPELRLEIQAAIILFLRDTSCHTDSDRILLSKSPKAIANSI